MLADSEYDALFAGVIGQEYELLKLISPLATEMSRLVGHAVESYARQHLHTLQILELGGGTGVTTLAILSATDNLQILSIDKEAVMQDQAKQNLHAWVEQGKLTFREQDALTALQALPEASMDLVASAYTLHNFENDYRADVHQEIFRVLKPGGQFINGDRYALDDVPTHTRQIQAEVSHWFEVLIPLQKADVLKNWIVHLFSDESHDHIMREEPALEQLANAGFVDIKLQHRQEVNGLVTALKPL